MTKEHIKVKFDGQILCLNRELVKTIEFGPPPSLFIRYYESKFNGTTKTFNRIVFNLRSKIGKSTIEGNYYYLWYDLPANLINFFIRRNTSITFNE